MHTEIKRPEHDRLISIKELLKIVPVGRPTIYRWEKARTFPQRIKIGTARTSRVFWSLNEVLDWVEEQREKSAPKTPTPEATQESKNLWFEVERDFGRIHGSLLQGQLEELLDIANERLPQQNKPSRSSIRKNLISWRDTKLLPMRSEFSRQGSARTKSFDATAFPQAVLLLLLDRHGLNAKETLQIATRSRPPKAGLENLMKNVRRGQTYLSVSDMCGPKFHECKHPETKLLQDSVGIMIFNLSHLWFWCVGILWEYKNQKEKILDKGVQEPHTSSAS